MRRSARRSAALALGLAALIVARASSAEAPSTRTEDQTIARLRIRFGNAQELESAARWAEALVDFRAIAHRQPTPEVLFHVGLCLDHLGRLLEARTSYRVARARARTRGKRDLVVTEATEHLADLESRLPRVTLAITGDGRGTKLILDGDRVVRAGDLRVDPGPHVVVALREHLVVAAVAFSARERHSKWITLTLLDRVSETAIATASQASRRMPIERATPSR